jgi:hypothetical protein
MLIQGILLHSKWYYATAQILTQTISLASFFPSSRLLRLHSCHTICSKLFILLPFFVLSLLCNCLPLYFFSSFGVSHFSSLEAKVEKYEIPNKKLYKMLLLFFVDKYLSNPVNVLCFRSTRFAFYRKLRI